MPSAAHRTRRHLLRAPRIWVLSHSDGTKMRRRSDLGIPPPPPARDARSGAHGTRAGRVRRSGRSPDRSEPPAGAHVVANTRSCAHAQRGLAAKGRGADASGGQGERFGCLVLPQGGGTTCSVAWRALRQRSWRSEGRLRPSKANGVTNCVPRDRVCATRQSVGRVVYVLSVGHV